MNTGGNKVDNPTQSCWSLHTASQLQLIAVGSGSQYWMTPFNEFCGVSSTPAMPRANGAPLSSGAGGIPNPPGGASGGVAGSGGRLNNVNFNEGLFQTYKVNSVRCSEIRRKIAEGTKPALPSSKVDQAPMCLAWHTKGQCNRGCPRAVDHAVYTTAEYQPLKTWCSANYLN